MTEVAPVPIFILGIQRSGTTFAGNLLAAHPDIAAVTAERHQGVHESVFFSHFARVHGDWSAPEARAKALAGFLASDYFRLTGLDPALPGIVAGADPAAFFRAVMERFAFAQGARAWIEKSPHHTLLADRIAAALPEARFLCVTRNTADLLGSRLWSYGRVPPAYPRRALTIATACASNDFHARFLGVFARRVGPQRAFSVDYAALKADPDAALAPLLSACGLPGLAGRRPAFRPNSSFSAALPRSRALTRTDRLIAEASALAAQAVPMWLLARLQARRAARRPAEFPSWVWTLPPETAPAGEG